MYSHLPANTDIFAAIAQFDLCKTTAEVGQVLTAALAGFGLKYFAIGGMPTQIDPNPTSFMYTNWPEEWQKAYYEHNFALVDPVPRAVRVCSMPLTLGELRAGKAGFVVGPEADDYFATAQRITGGKAGLIVPIAGPHGYHGIVVFVGEAEDFSVRDRTALHMLGIYAHSRLLNLFATTAAPNRPTFSLREIEVMRLARAGEGDEAIAQSLGISIRTVRFHFENTRKKLGVKSRAEALVMAVGLHLLGS